MQGPQPPQIQTIQPWFPGIQEAPIRLLDTLLPKQRQKLLALLLFYVLWILTFGLVYHRGTVVTEVEGYGQPVQLGCGSTFWTRGNECGLDGLNCRPFSNSSFAFRCPGDCKKRMVLNYRAVGAQEIVYRPLVIGGPSSADDASQAVYRGDSFICGAAIHAGVVSSSLGGCGVVSLIGQQDHYTSSSRNGIESIAFDSSFPSSFTFLTSPSGDGMTCEAKDMRWPLLAVSLTFTVVLSLFTTSPRLFYFTTFVATFMHVGFASDPPPSYSTADLFSNLIGKFLPASFCAFAMYRYSCQRTLAGLTAQIEKTVLWLGGCWLGALSNVTLDWIPIQRLNGHDLAQQPGAKLALAIIVILLVFIVAQQIYTFRLEGRLLRYLSLYLGLLASVLVCLLIPGLSLRIHHYILALLLIWGTSLRTRSCLLYQGLLIGLFINGIARWGFDSVLQTAYALRGDAALESPLPILLPEFPIVALSTVMSAAVGTGNITFAWRPPPQDDDRSWDGFSLLVNDVERFRGFVEDGYGGEGGKVWTWERGSAHTEYFRFGFVAGASAGDYTKAGTWLPDGSWVDMEPGPSRVRRRAVRDGDGRERLDVQEVR
jgi:hypothetical protein